jgi:DNA-binding transcriptional ArsR family regulator
MVICQIINKETFVPPRPKKLSPEALEIVADQFRVLADPTRLRILQALESDEESVTMLADQLGASQPNVSKHLKILQDGGFVRRKQSGNLVFYSINNPMVFELCELICEHLGKELADKRKHF